MFALVHIQHSKSVMDPREVPSVEESKAGSNEMLCYTAIVGSAWTNRFMYVHTK